MAETREAILDAAMQFEEDGYNFYQDAARKASNELAAKMFQSLAADEQNHIKWLRELLGGAEPQAEAVSAVYARLREIFANAPQSLKDRAKASAGDAETLAIGLEMEANSQRAYTRWAGECTDQAVVDLCFALANVEQGHWNILQNTLEYLTKTNDWFMQEELWIFDGG